MKIRLHLPLRYTGIKINEQETPVADSSLISDAMAHFHGFLHCQWQYFDILEIQSFVYLQCTTTGKHEVSGKLIILCSEYKLAIFFFPAWK